MCELDVYHICIQNALDAYHVQAPSIKKYFFRDHHTVWTLVVSYNQKQESKQLVTDITPYCLSPHALVSERFFPPESAWL